ncbi:calcium, potassium:sodium antiporter [Aureococcus anophagefferens]|nr:calcium, potassium:sodium antiporter [Aureococcus anophagefferens]|mmetsp:Transcript_21673/g.74772  ORF Transcript_21673/g.74772 Transcript_21673/m.74772 type:complete len:308 (+) Transcript_21673:50-973(+)
MSTMRLLPCLLAAATALQLPSIRTAVRPRVSALRMAEEGAPEPVPTPAEAPAGWQKVEETNIWGDDKVADIRIEGGQTLKTFKMPPHAERVQYILTSPNGRPVKARVELWIGPIRCVHELIYDCMNGFDFPLKATLQFKKLSPVLKIMGDADFEFPLVAGVFVPSPEESDKIGNANKDMFYSVPLKDKVQGGSTIDDKGGAIRSFDIPPSWEKTQIMVWSTDTGKKSFKTNIEVLSGPNNQKQHLNLRCGGSTQPYHAVIDTPGSSQWVIRCNSKKYLEDGLFEIAVAPYGPTVDEGPPAVVLNSGF